MRRILAALLLWGLWAVPCVGEDSDVQWPVEVRVFLKFMLSTSNLPDTQGGKFTDATKIARYDEAIDWLSRYYRDPPETIKVNTLGEYREVMQRNLPDLYTFDREMKFLRKGPLPRAEVQASAKVRSEIRNYNRGVWKWIASSARALAKQSGNQEELNTLEALVETLTGKEGLSALVAGLSKLKGDPAALVFELSQKKLPDSTKLAIVNRFEKAFGSAIGELHSVSDRLGRLEVGRSRDPRVIRILELFLGNYFKKLSSGSKREIISELIDHPGVVSDYGRFSLIVANSGPQFQKLLQTLSRESWLEPKLREIFKKLESSGRTVPWAVAQEAFDVSHATQRFVEVFPEPKGVGTMGQVHEAILEKSGKRSKVAVKFIKPGIPERNREDERIFQKIGRLIDGDPELKNSGLPKMAPIFEAVNENNRIDMNLAHMAKRQREARKVYLGEFERVAPKMSGLIEVVVPRVIPVPKDWNLFVQEFSEGDSFEALSRKRPGVAREVVEHLVEVWLGNALFGNGYFHADLHQGNLMIHVIEAKKRRGHTTYQVRLSLLDHGMNGKLSPAEQKAFLSVTAAVLASDPAAIARSLYVLRDPKHTEISEAQLVRRVRDKFKAQVDRPLDLGGWFSFASDEGLRYASTMAGFNRGLITMQSVAASLGSGEQEFMNELMRQGKANWHRVLGASFSGRGGLGLGGWARLLGKTVSGNLKLPGGCAGQFEDLND